MLVRFACLMVSRGQENRANRCLSMSSLTIQTKMQSWSSLAICRQGRCLLLGPSNKSSCRGRSFYLAWGKTAVAAGGDLPQISALPLVTLAENSESQQCSFVR